MADRSIKVGSSPIEALGLVGLGMVWGASYLFIKVAVADVPPLTLVAARLGLGAAVLWLLLGLTRQALPHSRSQWAAYTVMGLLNGAVPYSLITWGEQYIDSGLAALLQATMPIFTVLLAHLLTDEHWSRTKLLGVLVGFGGVGVLMVPDMRVGARADLWGQVAVVLSSISYAGAAIFARSRVRRQPPLVSTTGQLTMGAAIMVPLSLLIERPFHVSPSLPAVASWLALTLVGTVVAYVIYYALIERTSATFVSMVTYIIPIFGLILGALVLSEPLEGSLLVGLVLIILGVLLVRR